MKPFKNDKASRILIPLKCEISIYNNCLFLCDVPVDEFTPPTNLCKGVENLAFGS